MVKRATKRQAGGRPSLLDMGTDTVDNISSTGEFERQAPDDLEGPRDAKSIYIRNRIRQIINHEGQEHGMTVSELVQRTNFDRHAVQRHLDTLCSMREAYKIKRNGNTVLYYPNGIPMHGVARRRIEFSTGDGALDVTLAQGRRERLFFHILEKRFSLLEGETPEGAIVLPIDQVEEMIAALREMSQEVL